MYEYLPASITGDAILFGSDSITISSVGTSFDSARVWESFWTWPILESEAWVASQVWTAIQIIYCMLNSILNRVYPVLWINNNNTVNCAADRLHVWRLELGILVRVQNYKLLMHEYLPASMTVESILFGSDSISMSSAGTSFDSAGVLESFWPWPIPDSGARVAFVFTAIQIVSIEQHAQSYIQYFGSITEPITLWSRPASYVWRWRLECTYTCSSATQ